MQWHRFLADASPAMLAASIKAIEDWLETDLSGVAYGCTELELVDGCLSVASAPLEDFFAIRGTTKGQTFEAFFVSPASKRPKIGLSILSERPPKIPVALSKLLSLQDAVASVPSFAELSSLLSGKSIQISRATDIRSEEIAYIRQLLAEQADTIRRTQVELKEARAAAAYAEKRFESETSEEKSIDENLVDWCASNEDRIVVLPRARSGAKNSLYEDPALITVALRLLAGPYRQLRSGEITKADFDTIMLPTGLRLEGSVGTSVAGEQGDDYFVRWGGRRRLLKLHLTKGGGRDPRFCFRLYFFWDEDGQRAVVGSMTAHLSNSLS